MAKKKTKTSSRASTAKTTKSATARSAGGTAEKKKTSSKAKAAAASTRAKKTKTSAKGATTKTRTSTKKKTTKAAAATTPTSKKKKSTASKAAKEAASSGSMKTTKKTKAVDETVAADTKTKKSSKAKGAAEVEPKTATTTKKSTTKKTSSRSSKTAGGSNSNGKGYSVAEVASKAQADAQGYVFINGRRVRMISTKGAPPKKTTKTTARGETSNDAPARPKNIKTHLTKKQLNHYRELLIAKRHEIVGDLGAMEQEALRSLDGGTHMPIHMADVGTDTYDQDFMLGLAEAERKQLMEIDDALMRIQQNTYGVCVMTGNPIPDARLEAKPWAKYTIEAARQIEGGYTA